MTGQELIDSIKKYGLENLEIETGYFNCCAGEQNITFKVNDLELPYPKYKDYCYDKPAYIYTAKELTFYCDGSIKCEDTVLDTSKEY